MMYTVKKGDTLIAIAKKFGTTVEALVASNGITNPNIIRTGQMLEIPDNRVKDAVVECLDAIEKLPEFKKLTGLLEEG